MSSLLDGRADDVSRRVLRETTRAVNIDLLRSPQTAFSILTMILVLPFAYVGMWFAFVVAGPPATVTVENVAVENAPAETATAESSLDGLQNSFATFDGEPNTHVTNSGDGALVTLDATSDPSWLSTWVTLRDAGVAASDITVVNSLGEPQWDPLRTNLPLILMFILGGIAVLGVAVPIASHRERGLLQLFATTPLRRSTYLLAQLPMRLMVLSIAVALVVASAAALRYLDGNGFRLAFTVVLGVGFAFSVGFFFAARAAHPAAVQNLLVLGMMLAMVVSGGLYPVEQLWSGIQTLQALVPTTWLLDPLRVDLTGATPTIPVYLSWVLMAVSSAVLCVLAAKRFVWEQPPADHRSKRPPHHTDHGPTSELNKPKQIKPKRNEEEERV